MLTRKANALIAILSLGFCTNSLFADAKVEEQIVGPAVATGVSHIVSPRGVHLATVGMKGSRIAVTVDGVEGPAFDQMLQSNGQAYYSAGSGIDTRGQLAAVVFTEDGSRYAYCARLGNEAVVIVDGKEFARAPYNASVFAFGGLTFSPGGKHFHYVLWDQPSSKKTFFLDGKAMPLVPEGDQRTQTPAAVYWSPDDSRYFYYTAKAQGGNQVMALVIDGADAGYFGTNALFTADSKHVVCLGRDGANAALLMDGKSMLAGHQISRFVLPRVGNRVFAVATRPNTGGQLYYLIADGKKIDSTECLNNIDRITFSPDGKRYAARCRGQASSWVVVDGVKSQEYNGIHDEMTFSPDSSRFAYVASNGTRNFVVIDGVESNGYENVFIKPVFSSDGKRVGYIAGVNRLNLETVVDGKVVSKMNDASVIQFSPDGSRFAALAVGMGNGQTNLDGVDQKDFVTGDIQFSKDGKHTHFVGQRVKDRMNGLFVDGELLFKQTSRFTRNPSFSPDGNHLYWTAMEVNASVQPPRQSVIYVDNKPIGKWNSDLNQYFEPAPQTWEISPDGVLTTLMATPEGIKRIKITPDPSVTVASMVADVKAADAKALADAEAAKKAAEEAKAKAAADAQKARDDAAAAKAKQAADRAAAAQKARDDAAAARAARRGAR